jgi:hypothetical protein
VTKRDVQTLAHQKNQNKIKIERTIRISLLDSRVSVVWGKEKDSDQMKVENK